jgi:hypothetical protein
MKDPDHVAQFVSSSNGWDESARQISEPSALPSALPPVTNGASPPPVDSALLRTVQTPTPIPEIFDDEFDESGALSNAAFGPRRIASLYLFLLCRTAG